MAEIKPYGKGKWLVRVFIGRTAEGRMLRHNKVIRGLKTDAQKYARDVETKRDLGTLERPVNAARRPSDGLSDLVQTGLEDPALEGQLLSLYSSLRSLRPMLTRSPLELEVSSHGAPRISDLTGLIAIIGSVSSQFLAVDRTTNEQIENKLPDPTRVISEPTDPPAKLVDALEIARLLGYDTSTAQSIARARTYVYSLVRRNAIPFIKVSRKCLRFDVAKVREWLQGHAKGIPSTEETNQLTEPN
jgi:hypothetical protein